MLQGCVDWKNADPVDRRFACINPLPESHVLWVIVHDDRRDVVVVVQSFKPWIFINAELFSLISEHVLVVVVLWYMSDHDVVSGPFRL